MSGRLQGAVALITGACGDIGVAMCERFARDGAAVGVADLNVARAREVAERIRSEGGNAVAVELDVSEPDSAMAAVAQMKQQCGRLTILVNMAAAPTARGTTETMDLAGWKKTFDVNLTGAFIMSKHAIPAMREAGGGSIVNVASQLGHIGNPESSAYCTSKAALIFYTRMLAIDHARDNVRANSVSPGAISTTRSSVLWGGDKELAARVHGPKHLLGRPGKVDEVAAAASFLASDEASFITGTDLLVDGGYVTFKGTVDAERKPKR